MTDHPELLDLELTPRTDYLIVAGGLSLFGSARRRTSDRNLQVQLEEKVFVADSSDGGRSFSFRSWVVPWSDHSREAMPAAAL